MSKEKRVEKGVKKWRSTVTCYFALVVIYSLQSGEICMFLHCVKKTHIQENRQKSQIPSLTVIITYHLYVLGRRWIYFPINTKHKAGIVLSRSEENNIPTWTCIGGKQNKDFWSWRCFGRMWETEHVNGKWLLTLRRLRTVVDRRSWKRRACSPWKMDVGDLFLHQGGSSGWVRPVFHCKACRAPSEAVAGAAVNEGGREQKATKALACL